MVGVKRKAESDNDVFRVLPKSANKRLLMALPIPPSVNSMYINKRNGTKMLSSKAQHYVRDSRALINLFIEEQKWAKPSRETWLYCDVVFYMPDRRIRDSHNTLKLLMDVMQGIVYENDYFALPRIQSVEYDKDNPRIEVCVMNQNKSNREKGLKMTHVGV